MRNLGIIPNKFKYVNVRGYQENLHAYFVRIRNERVEPSFKLASVLSIISDIETKCIPF